MISVVDQRFHLSFFRHAITLLIALSCSTLVLGGQPLTTTNTPCPFHFVAISGTPTNPLLVINNYPYYLNDEGNVLTSKGHQHLKVIDIADHSATIELDGQRQTFFITNTMKIALTYSHISTGTNANTPSVPGKN